MCINMHTTTDMRHDLILICIRYPMIFCIAHRSFGYLKKSIRKREREIYRKIESFCNGMKTKQRKDDNLSLYLVIAFFLYSKVLI